MTADKAPALGMPGGADVAPSRCPLCGGANGCAMETARATGQPQPPCWCTRVEFSAELLARVPPEALRSACICARCAAQPVAGQTN